MRAPFLSARLQLRYRSVTAAPRAASKIQRCSMAKPIRSQETAQAISAEQWVPMLAQFTRENRGARARLEVIGVDEIGYAVETEDRPFDGVSADTKDREHAVWFAFGPAPDHLTHGVQSVTALR